jgi:tetratricopeptide (TPR) repeat protein
MKDASVWTNLGSAYRGHSLDFATTDITMRNKLVLKAEESYKRAISRDKNYGNAYYNMGLLYLDADPYPVGNGEMDRVTRLKNAKTYLDEYRRLPKADQSLVDETSAVVQKLLDREALLRKKKADREAKVRALEEKKRKRALEKKNKPDELDSDEGFE